MANAPNNAPDYSGLYERVEVAQRKFGVWFQEGPLHVRGGEGFHNFYNMDYDHGVGTGWKFHVSVRHDQVPLATEVVAGIYAQFGLEQFKVAGRDLMRSWKDVDPSKVITLYDRNEKRPDGKSRWRTALRALEWGLAERGVIHGPEVQGDRKIPNSNYIYYRHDNTHDSPWEYVPSTELLMLPKEEQYNPLGFRDPYKNMNLDLMRFAPPFKVELPPPNVHPEPERPSPKKSGRKFRDFFKKKI